MNNNHYTPSSIILWILLGLMSPLFLSAQPDNDLCDNSHTINVANYCSSDDAFTNENATSSDFSNDALSPNGKDVWFQFTAIATDVNIIVRGSGEGGTLRQPEIEFLVGTECIDSRRLNNEINSSNNIVELYRGGLIPGVSYFFRVQGANANEGTFQICVNNYFPPENAGSDLVAAAMLCGKTSFLIPEVLDTGDDPDEGRGTCLAVDPNSGTTSEQNSTWFTWIADNDGTLEFTLTPSNPRDDIDFVVFELPNGVNDPADRIALRCMATACEGPTGLSENSIDLEEDSNCDPGEDGFVKALDMREGVAYGVLINNFTSSGNGLTIDFGGSGEFRGPDPAFEAMVDDQVIEAATICAGEQISFSGANSSFLLGNIESYEWIFGAGANPQRGTGVNPGAVTYEEPGIKSVVLTITTDLGCKVSYVEEALIMVEPCCEIVNNIEGEGMATDAVCGNPNGTIDFMATSNSTITDYEWTTGETAANISGLAEGEYTVTVTNLATCTATYSYLVDPVPPFTIDTTLVHPQCSSSEDGAIELNIISESPISVTWSGGISTGTRAENLSAGTYNVTVEDANGCSEQATFELIGRIIELEPTLTITPPTCFGATNGFLEVQIANGTAPYQYDWADGAGFVNEESLRNIGANAYAVSVSDANGCEGSFEFLMEDPPALTVTLETINVSCGGLENGEVTATANGGTGDYTYNWDTNQSMATLTDLAPGTYSVTVVDNNLCETTDFTNITQPAAVSVAVDRVQDVLCNGGATGIINVSGTGGNPAYEYSINGSSFQTNSELPGLEAGTYLINIRDQVGCMSRVEATVNEPELLQVRIETETETIKLGNSTDLLSVVEPSLEEVNYEWWPSAIVDCTTCPETQVAPITNTPIRLTVTNSNSCTATDSLFLIVQPNRDLFIPTAFSPSLDGVNDRFTIFGGTATQSISLLRIYDRWGVQLFEATDIPLGDANFGWDGQFNGQDMPTGVFIYHAVVRFIDGVEVEYGGDITLLR